jgi:hypothetical protein
VPFGLMLFHHRAGSDFFRSADQAAPRAVAIQ